LAGRETDFVLNNEVNKNGGLHVILTFLPLNSRVEAQAFWRTSRSGSPGKGIMIFNPYHNFTGIITEDYHIHIIIEQRNKIEMTG
jgi:preprotein translocase subunit SecA